MIDELKQAYMDLGQEVWDGEHEEAAKTLEWIALLKDYMKKEGTKDE